MRFKFGGSAPPAMMSSNFSIRQSAQNRIKDLLDSKAANIQNQLRRQISKTIPVSIVQDDRTSLNSQSSNQHGSKPAPINDLLVNPLKYSSAASIVDHDDLLLINQSSYNELPMDDDDDDNISVQS
jgi:hypothetical protein